MQIARDIANDFYWSTHNELLDIAQSKIL